MLLLNSQYPGISQTLKKSVCHNLFHDHANLTMLNFVLCTEMVNFRDFNCKQNYNNIPVLARRRKMVRIRAANQVCMYLKEFGVLVTTLDAQWEGMGDVGSARYEPALLPPCPTIRVLSYSD